MVNTMKIFLIKIITSSIILAITAFFTPYFEITTLFSLIVAGLVITLIDYLFNILLGNNLSSKVRGIIAFLVSIVLLYGIQFIIPSYVITLPSAIIGAIIYSIIASHIPIYTKELNNKKASQDSTTS
ncbi:MAG: phage holin family protein [Clostridia bacterium]|nr:phage holin family protein [Clostridia bacterium]